MKVLLIQMDGKMPNLALMKLSSLHESENDEVALEICDPKIKLKYTKTRMRFPDKIYISCIFKKNLKKAQEIKKLYSSIDIDTQIGGPALWEPNYLPVEAEHLMPDYSLYPEMDYSLGYTQRGCPNNCPFCIVPKIEGSFKEYAPISEFQNQDFSKLVLYDNNFLTSKLWREKLDYIESQGLKVCFTQGNDLRQVTEEKAAALADCKSYYLSFKRRTHYFAWDLMEDSDACLRGLQLLLDAGIKPRCLTVYMLVGFNTTHQEDLYRFTKLKELKINPFVMIYNDRRDDQWLRDFARYVNKPQLYKSVALENYKNGVLREGG